MNPSEIQPQKSEWTMGLGKEGLQRAQETRAKEVERRMAEGGGDGRRDDSIVIMGRMPDGKVVYRAVDEDGVPPSTNEIPEGKEDNIVYSVCFESNPLNQGTTEHIMQNVRRKLDENPGAHPTG